jgi:hypothetical protein
MGACVVYRHPSATLPPMTQQLHPPPDHIAQFLIGDHPTPHCPNIHAQFAHIATYIIENIPRNPERTTALRKLLEAKDAAMRAHQAG